MSKPIFFQCLVLDNNDPLMLGRIRGTLITDNYSDIIRSFDDPPWNESKDAWTPRDPFIFNPLLPYFIYQVPKVKELVQIMYMNSDFKYQNQYYVQNSFYSPTSSYFTYQEGANKFTGTGMQIENPKPLKNAIGTISTDNNIYTEKGVHKGVFPEPGDNAILGRGSADLIVKEDEVLLRAGKFVGDQLQPNVIPVANQQRGFLQLSRFPSVKIPLEPKTYLEIEEKVLIVRYLVEFSIDNPENAYGLFTGAVYLYQLKPDLSTNTQNVTVSSVINENLKTLVTFQEFIGLSETDTIIYINNFIRSCNSDFITKEGNQLFPSTLTDRYPIYYRPNNKTYSYISPSNVNIQSIEFNNVSKIYSQIKLFAPLKQSGYGLIYQKDTVGTPMDTKKVVVPQSKYVGTPQTYSALGGDKLFLLSHQSAIPGKKKINFDDTLYGISNDKFSDDIMPNTSSTVRGEELLELLNLITRFLLTHTHAYPGLPPVPVTQDGTSSTQILTELQNAVTKVLNEYIRIN